MKSMGLSKIIHSISNIEVHDGIAGALRKKLFNFIWKNKKDRKNEPPCIRTKKKEENV